MSAIEVLEEALTSAAVLRRLGGRITYRQLDYLCRTGKVAPSVRDAAGHSGTNFERLWSPLDLLALQAIVDVLERQARETAAIASGEMWAELHRGLRGM